MHITLTYLFFALIFSVTFSTSSAQSTHFSVIAYYAGGPQQVDSIAAEKLTHIIFSFCHLKGNKLTVDNKKDSLTIHKLVGLKKQNPQLKVILSLGGWGGCPSCSDVFSSAEGRKTFSRSTLALLQYFKADGIDLDWEYPTIEGYPGHKYTPSDKKNFTSLIHELRKTLNKNHQISFAAGGFKTFLDTSVDWKEIMQDVDRVNIMSYDLINGYSTETGHHTALYSTPHQGESSDNAIQYLVKLGIPRNKLVIGAAFYARIWEGVPPTNNGLYQAGKFKTAVDFKGFSTSLSEQKGFTYYWDDTAKAPYAYDANEKLFATFDDKKSIAIKTQYVIDNQLDGIMFWELTSDKSTDGLLDVIDHIRRTSKNN